MSQPRAKSMSGLLKQITACAAEQEKEIAVLRAAVAPGGGTLDGAVAAGDACSSTTSGGSLGISIVAIARGVASVGSGDASSVGFTGRGANAYTASDATTTSSSVASAHGQRRAG